MRPSWTEEDCSTETKKERAGSSENKMAARAAKTPRKEPKDVFFYKTAGNGGFLGCGKWLQPSNCYAALGPRNLILL